MKDLVINDRNHGKCTVYRQNRTAGVWMFAMEDGIEIYVPFYMIKQFDSSGDTALELSLYSLDNPAKSESEV